MTAAALDEFMLRLAPQPPREVDASLIRARQFIRAALDELAQVSDPALERPWPWRGDDADVRYGFYRQFEALEDAQARLQAMLGDAFAGQSPARPLLGAASAARWELHGLLTGLADDVLDADAGGAEWTVRQTLAHIVSGQRAYGWFTTWWLSRRDDPADELPARVPDEVVEQAHLPEEETEGEGTLADIRARLDEITDLSAGVFAPLGAEQLATRARWSGIPVDVRFRLGRWSSHIREHTVQVEKTLDMIERRLSEVERLTRLIAGAWGRLEGDLYMWPAGDGQLEPALTLAEQLAAGIARDAASVRASAG